MHTLKFTEYLPQFNYMPMVLTTTKGFETFQRREFEGNGKGAIQNGYDLQIGSNKLINLYGQLGNYYEGKEI